MTLNPFNLVGKTPRSYWQYAYFRTREEMVAWLKRYGKLAQWREIYIDNGFGVEHRLLMAYTMHDGGK